MRPSIIHGQLNNLHWGYSRVHDTYGDSSLPVPDSTVSLMQLGFLRDGRRGVEIYAYDHNRRSDVMGKEKLYGIQHSRRL